MKITLVISSIFLSLQIFAQDYFEYHRIINRIDENIINEEYSIAIERLDSLSENYNFIFARHCFKALQICCKSGDTINANIWLEKSFIQGIPIWMLKSNELTKNVFNYSTTQHTIEQYDSLHNIYTKSINHVLRNKIDSLFAIDQLYTRKVNDGFILLRHTYHGLRWLKNNKNQFEILNEIIDTYGYPGERLIGLPKFIEDSAQFVKHFSFYGPFLKETDAYIMLIHYYSNPRSDINNKLFKNVKLGNLPPYQYGALNDFMAKWGKKKYGDFKYFNVWHQDTDSSKKAEIDDRRNSIGLNSCEQQNRNNLIWKERRKNNTANSEIILE